MGEGFRNLIAWQKAYKFVLEVYVATKSFPKDELYCLTSQTRRAVISVLANIAEGYERQSRKEYVRFLRISKGSLGEVETYLLLAKDLEYLKSEKYNELESQRVEVAKLLRGLINSLH